jgi:predicted SprT family Zn-dependent metalloprotease
VVDATDVVEATELMEVTDSMEVIEVIEVIEVMKEREANVPTASHSIANPDAIPSPWGPGVELSHFLESEGLREEIGRGLRDVASDFGRESEEFTRAGWAALEGWQVRSSRAISRFGSISPGTRILRITSLDCSPEARRDTILHEVAHILTAALVTKREKHGPHWQRMASALGARPRSRGDDERFRVAAQVLREARLKVVARCERCGHEIKRMRRSDRCWRRFVHRPCGGRLRAVDPGLT